jgi:rare lipoprotein A
MRLRAKRLACGVLIAASFPAAPVAAAPSYEATGAASWYGDELRGRKTANGEIFNPDRFTAAHRTLPMSAYVEVTALDTGKTIIVRINDRGPYHGNRLIDLSLGAARALGIMGHGARLVHVRQVARSTQQRELISGTALDQLRARSQWAPPPSAGVGIPAGGGPYYIRFGTFSSKNRAQSMAGRLGAKLFEADGLYQVRLGPYADANKVNAALAPLAAKGYPDVRIVR